MEKSLSVTPEEFSEKTKRKLEFYDDIRTHKNIRLSNLCPHCERRLWQPGDKRKTKRVHWAPKWFRELFISKIGFYPLGTFYVTVCEVCRRGVAVFENIDGTVAEKFGIDAVVLYSCSLTSVPLGDCRFKKSCYGCEYKKSEYFVSKKH